MCLISLKTRDNLTEIDEKVKVWIGNNLNHFAIHLGSGLFNNEDKLEKALKAFCELCFLYNFLDKKTEFSSMIKDFLCEIIDKNDFDSFLITNPDKFMGLMSVDNFSIYNRGKSIFSDTEFIKICKNYLKTPFRMIEIDTFLNLNYDLGLNNTDYFREKTVIGINKNINSLSYNDIYSITHQIFYEYFEEKYKTAVRHSYNKKDMKEKLLSLAVYLSNDGNIDVMLEVLLCLKLKDFDFSEEDRHIIEVLSDFILKLQNDGGYIAPHTKLGRKYIEFYDVYHTTTILKGLVDVWIED